MNPILISKFSPFIPFLAKNKNVNIVSILSTIVEVIKSNSLILLTPLKKMQIINIIEDTWPNGIIKIYNELQKNYPVTLEYGSSLRIFELRLHDTTLITSTSVSPEFMKKVKIMEINGLKCICKEFFIIDELYKLSTINTHNPNSITIDYRKESMKNITDTYRFIEKPKDDFEISTTPTVFNSSIFENTIITGQLGILIWIEKLSEHIPYSTVYKYQNDTDQHLFFIDNLFPHVLSSEKKSDNVLGCIFNYRYDVYIKDNIRYEIQSRPVEYFEHGKLKITNIFKCLSDCLIDSIFTGTRYLKIFFISG